MPHYTMDHNDLLMRPDHVVDCLVHATAPGGMPTTSRAPDRIGTAGGVVVTKQMPQRAFMRCEHDYIMATVTREEDIR
jgi:hypothetical protein